MVKAIRFHEFGGPEVLKLEDINAGDVLYDVSDVFSARIDRIGCSVRE
ncbi:MAG TPA: NADPH:quinone reductase, partial [Rhodospirillales bacterium]|nr:NADPH:quinone reductase [Rhodospirillales bacterium]